ncbi:MAG TPA: VWA domain-containing protein [Pyrinomonadaceae bacterium]|jgi:VWFA-related protein|nr:VWA domain-containing protein [Pyrinomonadaceae bacterium]
MRKYTSLLLLALAFLIPIALTKAQSRARRVGTAAPNASVPAREEERPPAQGGQVNRGSKPASDAAPSDSAAREEVGQDEVVRVNTTLVSVPVSVMDRDGKYIPDLRKEDFRLYEDGAEQPIAYFASTDKPFTVALLLDTSRSTRFRLEDIQDAAIAFVNQLRADDRVMVVAFDDEIEVLTEPTNDRNTLRDAIRQSQTGGGTRLYDAVDLIINKRFNRITGRKAIVLFTDGVDTTSRRASYDTTVRDAEELDALIYPISYNTYDPGFGNTGGIGWPLPRRRRSPSILNWPLPFPFPGGGGIPGGGGGGGGSTNGTRAEYDRAEAYLNELAQKTGARLSRADSLQNLNRAFELIAEELRRQYSLGYYPQNVARQGERRQIKVRMREPNLVVRARDSYVTNSAPAGVATKPSRQFRSL